MCEHVSSSMLKYVNPTTHIQHYILALECGLSKIQRYTYIYLNDFRSDYQPGFKFGQKIVGSILRSS